MAGDGAEGFKIEWHPAAGVQCRTEKACTCVCACAVACHLTQPLINYFKIALSLLLFTDETWDFICDPIESMTHAFPYFERTIGGGLLSIKTKQKKCAEFFWLGRAVGVIADQSWPLLEG